MKYTADSFLSWIVVGNLDGARGSLQAGADPNQKDEMGISALRLAIRSRRKDLIALLLAFGASVSEEDLTASIGQHDDLDLFEFITREKGKTPNKAPEPTTMAVTSRAPSSTSRASHGRGSS
jgi:ankyrin repeat protein